ncbi:secreted RxLR effector protein 161-like [Photinus pyralis]|uniref:secreted RxLR effector protein 161-like n=1 Tax=Photinus pyralis TaxID=7054 RepID=UPI0012674A10|nr:secreted RxLR effector protein 161-like [Photinus pyralis]
MCPNSEDEAEKMSRVPYQEAVGSLLFAAQVSRPDISFAVNNVSRYTRNPGLTHWTATKRIMRYLRGTIQYKLEFDGQRSSQVIGYADSDWANNVDDRRSITGYAFLKNGTAISWGTKRQSTVSLSTTESEYMAMSMATQEALWLRNLSAELGFCKGPIVPRQHQTFGERLFYSQIMPQRPGTLNERSKDVF